jgi:rubrerythrin
MRSSDRHQALLTDMRRALLAEFGARAIYAQLEHLCRDPELAGVLARMHDEEARQIESLRSIMLALGARPRRRSTRRWILAALLAWTTPIFGLRFCLRTCKQAETTASRWYAQYREYLSRCGEHEHAHTCAELSLVKHRHAQMLQAWATDEG